ncbi:MAG: hypothetical protein HOP11_02390 [Saprospiraceae bacterium]|nr:hypothetical protein [Saprospiraceae bacterium]
MKAIWIITFVIITFSQLESQELRGLKPAKSLNAGRLGTTRALIIGVSDYKDSLITDLQYAHRDAEEFAKYLHSKEGYGVDLDNIILLTNEQASGGRVMMSLSWLLDMSKEGDQVIIYFAGHGDVESKLLNSSGYLLLWDSPNRSYFLNALSVSILHDILNTLSVNNKARVLFISDACHSGTLAGNGISGTSLTAQNMMNLFRNQMMVLSCQPDELSIEGKQWGNGRGLFSYHFVDGLKGFANTDQDSIILLKELERYVQDKVAIDAQKVNHTQTPVVHGNINQLISYVDPKFTKLDPQQKPYEIPAFNNIGSRSVIRWELENQDTSVQRIYKEFQYALDKKEFLDASDGRMWADTLYKQLESKVKEGVFINSVKNQYVAELTDDANSELIEILNDNSSSLLKAKLRKSRRINYNKIQLYRAKELIGSEHFYLKYIQARIYLFEGLILFYENSNNKNIKEGNGIIKYFNQSLELEPNAPFTYFFMMVTHALKFGNKDSTIYYCEKSISNSNNWIVPYCFLASYLCEKFDDSKLARHYVSLIESKANTNLLVKNVIALVLFYENQLTESLKLFTELSQQQPNNFMHQQNLGIINYKLKNKEQAEINFLEAVKIDSSAFNAYYFIGLIHYDKKLYNEAIFYANKSIEINSNFLSGLKLLGVLNLELRELDLSELYLKRVLSLNEKEKSTFYYLSLVCLLRENKEEFFRYFDLALKNGYSNINNINNSRELNLIRNDKDFIDLLNKYNLK